MIIDTLNESEAMPDQVQMIHWLDGVCEQTPRSDSTVIHAHHQTAGAKAFSVIDVKTLHAKIGELTLTNDAPQGLRGPTGATVPAAMSGALGKAGLLSRCPAGDCLAICRKGSAKR